LNDVADCSGDQPPPFSSILGGKSAVRIGAISADGEEAPSKLPDPMSWAPADGELIKSPKDAINVFGFEPVAHKNVPPAHFGYMASGIDDEVTLRANREGFLKFQLLPRRLGDVSKVDTSVQLFGADFDSPIFVCPTSSNKAFHPDGEVAVAKAARAGNHLQILATASNYSAEDVTNAQSGSSFTPRRAGRLRRPSSSELRPPAVRSSWSRSTVSRAEIRKPSSG